MKRNFANHHSRTAPIVLHFARKEFSEPQRRERAHARGPSHENEGASKSHIRTGPGRARGQGENIYGAAQEVSEPRMFLYPSRRLQVLQRALRIHSRTHRGGVHLRASRMPGRRHQRLRERNRCAQPYGSRRARVADEARPRRAVGLFGAGKKKRHLSFRRTAEGEML